MTGEFMTTVLQVLLGMAAATFVIIMFLQRERS